MTKREELNAALLMLGKGLNAISSAAMDSVFSKDTSPEYNYRDRKTDALEAVGNIINGETEDGFAQSCYVQTFKYSLDEEIAAFDDFLYAFTGKEYDSTVNEEENIQNVLTGFKCASVGLSKVLELVRSNKELKNTLQTFTWVPEMGTEPRNLFAETPPYIFVANFRSWERAFKEELRETIGRNMYYKNTKSVKQLTENKNI